MSSPSTSSSRPANDSRRLRQIFDRRAVAFDAVAFLPREIAQRMCERLEYIKVTPAAVLDAGCGAGDDLPALRARFPEAPVYGVDLSGAMLARARAARIVHSDAPACALKGVVQSESPVVRTRVQAVQGIVLLDVFALRRMP